MSTVLFIAAVAIWAEAVHHYRRPVVRNGAWCRRPVSWLTLLALGWISIPWAALRLARALLRAGARQYARLFPTGPAGRRLPIASRVVTETRLARVALKDYRTIRRVWFCSGDRLPHPATPISNPRAVFDRLLDRSQRADR